MCIAIIVAEPLNVKPAKDGLKDIFFPRKSDENGQPIETNESLLAHFLLVFCKKLMWIERILIPYG